MNISEEEYLKANCRGALRQYSLAEPSTRLADGFTCQGCKHQLPMEFNVRTKNFCYLCDPNITLEECLSDEPLERVPKAIR